MFYDCYLGLLQPRAFGEKGWSECSQSGPACSAEAQSPSKPAGPPMPSVPVGVARPGGQKASVTVELFLDLCCPYSNKMFKTISEHVAPKYEGEAGLMNICSLTQATLDMNKESLSQVKFVFHSVAQPWHAQSCYMHEASLAVLDSAGPQKFWDFAGALFCKQEEFFDDMVMDKTRNELYSELAKVAEEVGVAPAEVLNRLQLKPGNAGSAVTQRFKWATKLHRSRGVHVTPTVHLNGLEAGVVGSGWSPEEWQSFLDYHLAEAKHAA
ncbi:unnamed protein product [Polarella glacialis]|uniref:Thioredoxin-like fold domain-containing protein n=1 Tax=Polarella glacialis TaxID=89957 RepID=A0A813G1E7_POLGL|nr:unnamed protein product [Polarella glacialis]